jgi:excisionase family DNA binding protein
VVGNLTRRTIVDRATSQPPSVTATQDPGRLMTLNEVSDLLGIPVATLYRWRHRGEGPPGYRIGRHVRYRRAAIEEWIESRADARTPW